MRYYYYYYCDVRQPSGLRPSHLVAMGFFSEVCPVCLPKYWPMVVVSSDLSAVFKKNFDLRSEEVQFWERTLIG